MAGPETERADYIIFRKEGKVIEEKPGKPLRYYQEIAINRAILSGQRRVLINMATGTGKTDLAWKVSARELLDGDCNLDRKNPRSKEDFEHLHPEQLADDILKKEQGIAELMAEIKAMLKDPP